MKSTKARGWGGRIVSVAVFALAYLGSTAAGAGTEGDRDLARAHYRQAVRHYNLGEFEAALEEFKASYRLHDDAALLFNVGQCEWKLDRLDAAVRSYRAYLRMRPAAENRAEVEKRIVELEARARQSPARPAPEPPSPSVAVPAGLTPRRDLNAPVLAAVSVDRSENSKVEGQIDQSRPRGWALWAIGGAVVLAGIAAVILTQPRGTNVPPTDLGAQGVFR